ncbi:unnamed protein product [Mycena citricolor]|uniref:Transmembrane protein n=1 Tax=Mycena citricolor TaxID=2018698 RepID=A0AAD2HFP3_9AGAR|nr:unnamed protein product [Mycena citricolor]
MTSLWATPFLALPLLFLLFLAAVPVVESAITNTTVDDADPAFVFSGSWTPTSAAHPCDFCSSKPDPSQTFDQTWTDGNYRAGSKTLTTGTFTFTGSAVYIFGIDQADSQPDIVFTLGATTATHHYTGSARFAYNALFFAATGLPADQTHTVSWVFNTNPTTGVQVQAALFDYAVVTSGSADPPTQPAAPPSTNTPSPTTPAAAPATSLVTVIKTQAAPSPSPTLSAVTANSPNSLTTTTTTSSVSVTTILKSVSPAGQSSSSSSANKASSAVSETALAHAVVLSTSATSSQTPVPTSTQDSPAALTSAHHVDVGAIVGAVIGVLVGGVLAFVLFVLFRRRRQVKRSQQDAERRAAGLPPVQGEMRRIRGNNVLQPFVDERPPASLTVGNLFATSTFASASSNANPPLSRSGTMTRETLPLSPEAAAAPLSVDTRAGRFPPEKMAGYIVPTPVAGPSRSISRQPSQSQSETSSRRDTVYSEANPPSLYPSERERYLEQRLATLEAHVANQLPPPYEQPEPPATPGLPPPAI